LALKGAGHQPFAKSFDAVHLGFHQASPVITTPALSDASLQGLACGNRCIAMFKNAAFADAAFSRWNDWSR
jgi:hypothetical protein